MKRLYIKINERDTINPVHVIRKHGDADEITVVMYPGDPLVFRGRDAARVCRWLDALAMREPEEMACPECEPEPEPDQGIGRTYPADPRGPERDEPGEDRPDEGAG